MKQRNTATATEQGKQAVKTAIKLCNTRFCNTARELDKTEHERTREGKRRQERTGE
jgi:hypothetical protein